MSLGKEQYGKSVAELERFRTETWDELTSILVRFDDQENQRRIVEENNRLDRYEALQIEAVTSGRKNAAIEMKWADLLNMDIPQELNDQLQFQKSACRQIIESKDRRIEDFKTELKNKDEEYIKMLKQQRVDITTLISKMREQYHSLRQHYEQQLEDIEQAFEEERKEMLQKNKADLRHAPSRIKSVCKMSCFLFLWKGYNMVLSLIIACLFPMNPFIYRQRLKRSSRCASWWSSKSFSSDDRTGMHFSLNQRKRQKPKSLHTNFGLGP